LSCPNLNSGAAAQRLLERGGDEVNAQPGLPHELGRCRILGDFGRQRLDPTAGVEKIAPPDNAFPLGEAKTETLADILPAGLEGIQKRPLELGPKPLWVRTALGKNRRMPTREDKKKAAPGSRPGSRPEVTPAP